MMPNPEELNQSPQRAAEGGNEQPESEGTQESPNPDQPEHRPERSEELRAEVERQVKEAQERLANQFGSIDTARAWVAQEVRDPYSSDQREGQIYFARANLFVLEEGQRMLGAIERLGQPAQEGKRVTFAGGFTLGDVERKLAEFDDVARKEFNLPEAKGHGETREEQINKYNVQIQEFLIQYNAFAEFPPEGEGGPQYGAHYQLRLLQKALESGNVAVDTQGRLYTLGAKGREYLEEEIEKHRATLSGQ